MRSGADPSPRCLSCWPVERLQPNPPTGSFREVCPPRGGATCGAIGGYGCSVRHCKAGLCTALARFGASLAVVHAVLAALGRAASTCDRAERADGLPVCTAPGDGSSAKPADVGALQIQRNAPRHGFRVGLLEARRRALEAGRCALVACSQACILDLAGHGNSLKFPHVSCCTSLAASERSGCASAYAPSWQLPPRVGRHDKPTP